MTDISAMGPKELIITGSTPPISINLHRLKGNNNCETGVDYKQCLKLGQSDPATLPVVLHRRQISIELYCNGKACCAFELYYSRACKATAVWSHELQLLSDAR